MGVKKKAGLFVLILFVSVAGLVLVYGDRIVISFYGGGLVFNHSTSMNEHKVSTGKTDFCVPEAYFVFSNSFHPGSSIGLNLSMELESFEPWNVYGERIGFLANRKNMTVREVDEVLSKEINLEIMEQFEGRRSIDRKWKLVLQNVQKQDDGEFVRLFSESAPTRRYSLVPHNASDYSYIIDCTPGAKCKLDTYYDDSIVYTVGFDEAHLSLVNDIDLRVRGLIEKLTCK